MSFIFFFLTWNLQPPDPCKRPKRHLHFSK